MSRQFAVPFVLLLLLLARVTLATTQVTLPDTGTYAYWVQSPSGTVTAMPVTITAHTQFTLPDTASRGTLNVLDRHTGGIAELPLTGQNLTLSVGDFKPMTTGTPAVSPVAPVASAPSAPIPPTNGIARLFTLLFGLLVAGCVGWVIWLLVQSRGQPLIAAARRLGVDVPDPSAPMTEEQAASVYTPPAPRVVEKIPEEAGVTPLPPLPIQRRTTVGTFDAPQIVGVQGVAAGSTFAVPVGEVKIGRDGDNEIVLAESTVSRLHARLRRDAGGRITLADNGSANGVFVNGQRISETILTTGDQIQVGDNHFRLES